MSVTTSYNDTAVVSSSFIDLRMEPNTVTPSRPPTLNNLDRADRQRLIRSTRKLGAVLGTTPLLLDANDQTHVGALFARRHRRWQQSHGALSNRNASFSSTAKLMHRDDDDAASFVDMDEDEEDHHVENIAPNSQRHPGPSQLVALDLPKPAQLHTRYERVEKRRPEPEEFVTPTRPVLLCLHDNAESLSPTASASVPPTPTTAASATFTVSSPSTPAFDALEQRRKKMAKLTRHLGAAPPTDLVFPPSPTRAVVCRTSPRSSDGGKVSTIGLGRRRARAFSVDLHRLSANVDFVGIARSVASQGKGVPPLPIAGGRDSSEAWVGHWNRNDIRTVQQQLRQLKA
ncbi:hypothetical protein PUNSTDRAFT_117138 [Punctularia strigosozonata HHB-11173 SS5]|uniref:uncharacterized protein n=1 Tax=Punctularia strigosozonata (strain HHB-11173) TaxID=741275 RepID=UPI00044173D2|nr:uncharacterized protein PUNSTDRAFT_117138 [Punctularia strigosozonata HHB-11173 SS5]EIN13300.1 hypothetical protein PUNSTDRAFT_117138 [Punctularia strigosozonata HHB-11173 SS5]